MALAKYYRDRVVEIAAAIPGVGDLFSGWRGGAQSGGLSWRAEVMRDAGKLTQSLRKLSNGEPTGENEKAPGPSEAIDEVGEAVQKLAAIAVYLPCYGSRFQPDGEYSRLSRSCSNALVRLLREVFRSGLDNPHVSCKRMYAATYETSLLEYIQSSRVSALGDEMASADFGDYKLICDSLTCKILAASTRRPDAIRRSAVLSGPFGSHLTSLLRSRLNASGDNRLSLIQEFIDYAGVGGSLGHYRRPEETPPPLLPEEGLQKQIFKRDLETTYRGLSGFYQRVLNSVVDGAAEPNPSRHEHVCLKRYLGQAAAGEMPTLGRAWAHNLFSKDGGAQAGLAMPSVNYLLKTRHSLAARVLSAGDMSPPLWLGRLLGSPPPGAWYAKNNANVATSLILSTDFIRAWSESPWREPTRECLSRYLCEHNLVGGTLADAEPFLPYSLIANSTANLEGDPIEMMISLMEDDARLFGQDKIAEIITQTLSDLEAYSEDKNGWTPVRDDAVFSAADRFVSEHILISRVDSTLSGEYTAGERCTAAPAVFL